MVYVTITARIVKAERIRQNMARQIKALNNRDLCPIYLCIASNLYLRSLLLRPGSSGSFSMKIKEVYCPDSSPGCAFRFSMQPTTRNAVDIKAAVKMQI